MDQTESPSHLSEMYEVESFPMSRAKHRQASFVVISQLHAAWHATDPPPALRTEMHEGQVSFTDVLEAAAT